MPRIVLHIDRLVLRGVARVDAAALSEALQVELQTMLRLPGGLTAFAASDGTHVLKAGQATLPPGSDAGEMGRAIAARVTGGAAP